MIMMAVVRSTLTVVWLLAIYGYENEDSNDDYNNTDNDGDYDMSNTNNDDNDTCDDNDYIWLVL